MSSFAVRLSEIRSVRMEVAHKADSPDSTTKERPMFSEGEEVLVRMKEGRYFLGTVNQINAEEEQCLVKFADGTELWSKFVDINSTAVSEVDDVMCVLCKSSFCKPNNSVLVCKSCSRGYHQLCHKPAVKEVSSIWECKRCSQNSPSSSKHVSKTKNSSYEKPLPSSPSELPYDPASLVWYMQHRFNTQQTYCYCGASGEWYLKMLQCLRCLQWYHEKCIRALCYPLYIGDRFYIYICSVCNKGNEFLRRVEFSWTDLVHLLLFNLTAYKAKNRFSENDIVEYANLHWPFLQLPPKIFKVLESYRKEYILESLRKSSRFKFASKNGTAGWGLRLRVPPSVPAITVPSRTLSDQTISQLLLENDRLKNVKFFIPPSRNQKLLSPEEIRTIPTNGLHNLHVDRSALSLPKGISTTGHNVCIKSATPYYPESRAVILRKIKQQQGGCSRNSSSSSSQQCEPIKIRVKTNKLENSHEVAEITGGSESLPPTPPYSVSAPNTPTPDTSHTDAQNMDEEAGLDEDLSVPPTPATSSGDETADVNPCETRTNKSLLQLLGHREETKPSIALPLPLNPVITQPQVKPVKRRLSEKDIRVNRNGEVKRRRIRRQCTLQQPKLEPIAGGSASAQLITSEYAHVSYSASPYSNEDLRAAVYEYFSASNRIAMGERFRIRGKRVLSDGKVQWFIEWKSCLT
ncbi:hypothetical protein M8J75_011958 [Diaphorina citri]|nr:hypothetical protein M8J75_011958 [Diaphorina citri]